MTAQISSTVPPAATGMYMAPTMTNIALGPPPGLSIPAHNQRDSQPPNGSATGESFSFPYKGRGSEVRVPSTVLSQYGNTPTGRDDRLNARLNRTAPFLEMGPRLVSTNLLHLLREHVVVHLRDPLSKAVNFDVPVRIENIRVPDSAGAFETGLPVS